ncbi:uncharacterized protein LOC21389539 isoform X2 [Morus notabilis]|uniref:uncharacterized protein LOC21389539 isoform X2 n=1 Tax=Morus notabilis TaxID=981085 RepID=UPI000CED635E|nr:uncharacterized protein LOC21389539 isoform X2 [Morus notabilis]
MDRNGLAAVFLFFLIVSDFSDASSLLFNLGKFVVTKDSVPGSPVPISGPVTGENKLDSKPVRTDGEKELDQNSVNEIDQKPKLDPKPVNGETKLDTKPVTETSKDTKLDTKPGSGTTTEKNLDSKPAKETQTSDEKKLDPKPANKTSTGKESDTQTGNETSNEKPVPPVPKDSLVQPSDKDTSNSQPQNGKTEKKKEEKTDSGSVSEESCDGLSPSCIIQNVLVACIKSFDVGSKVVVLVQNKGESNLKANISVENIPEELKISKFLTNGKNANIILCRGKDECVVHLHSTVSEEISFLRFPSYDKLVTPVNGAYFLILAALIFGGTWTCIKFSRRKRQGGGIPYQELEMALPESVSAADVETAEGWDQGWDDDWDDDSAVKSPGARHVGSISANGLTSRSPNKDGWEDNWDD